MDTYPQAITIDLNLNPKIQNIKMLLFVSCERTRWKPQKGREMRGKEEYWMAHSTRSAGGSNVPKSLEFFAADIGFSNMVAPLSTWRKKNQSESATWIEREIRFLQRNEKGKRKKLLALRGRRIYKEPYQVKWASSTNTGDKGDNLCTPKNENAGSWLDCKTGMQKWGWKKSNWKLGWVDFF